MKTATGLTVAGAIALIALHGKAFFESAHAGWLFVRSVTAEMPLGLGQFLLALLLAVLSQPMLRRHLPHRGGYAQHVRTCLVETVALLIGLAVMWGLAPTLTGMLLGLVAGLAAPYLYRVLAAMWASAWGYRSRPPGRLP